MNLKAHELRENVFKGSVVEKLPICGVLKSKKHRKGREKKEKRKMERKENKEKTVCKAHRERNKVK